MYNKYILVTLIPLPGLPILLPHQLPLLSTNSPPTIMAFCFLLCKLLSLNRTTCLGMGAGIWANYLHHWKQRCPLSSVAPERWARPMNSSLTHDRMLTGLVSCRLCRKPQQLWIHGHHGHVLPRRQQFLAFFPTIWFLHSFCSPILWCCMCYSELSP